MQRADSPASLVTRGSEAANTNLRHHEIQRPSYRLFPAVEPTPPTSPQSLQKIRLQRASEYQKKRSISLDDSARRAAAKHNAPDRVTSVNRGQMGHQVEVVSMSTVPEWPADSPTVPGYGILSRTSEEDRSRSSSAPGEFIRDSQTLPARGPAWASKQAGSHPMAAPVGLGLSMPVSRLADRPSTRQGPQKQKPSLTIEIKKQEDRPPPPPPKSPRHARTPSVQSGVSSMHGESPSSGTVATPGSIMRAALVDAQGSPVQMPPVLHAKQGSYSSSSSDMRVREVVLKRDPSGQPKPNNPQSTTSVVGKDLAQANVKPSGQEGNLDQAVSDTPWQLPMLPFMERDHVRTHSAGNNIMRPSGTGSPLVTDREHSRTLSAETTSTRPTDVNRGQPQKDGLGGGAQSRAAGQSREELRMRPSGKPQGSSVETRQPGERRAPPSDTSRVLGLELRRMDEKQDRATDKSKTVEMKRSDEPRARPQDQSQAPPPKVSSQAMPEPQERSSSRAADVSSTSKPNKANLDKPMPSLPTSSRGFQDHYREVQEAEESEKSERPKLKPSAPSQASTKTTATSVLYPDAISSAPLTKDNRTAGPSFADRRELERHAGKSGSGNRKADEPQKAKEATEAPGHKKSGSDMRTPLQSLNPIKKIPSRDLRSPTPDLGSRSQTPPTTERSSSAMSKALPISFSEGNSYSRSPTPDIVSRLVKTPESNATESDPIETLRTISKQVDALHARYTQLRSDRLRLSTAISASLKDQKPGPDYANTLLDQHLSINAINSSMDICFAKLKSLDCRKEDAIAALIAQTKPKSIAEDSIAEDSGSVASWKSNATTSLTAQSGRSTPDVEQKTLSPAFYKPSKLPPSRLSPSIASTMSSATTTPDLRRDVSPVLPLFSSGFKPTSETEKRVTVIRDSPEATAEVETASKVLPQPPMSPISVISSIDEEKSSAKRIRIKGAKAAKLLGLVNESRYGKPGSPDITLPDGSSLDKAGRRDNLAIEVEIQSKFSSMRAKPSPASAQAAATVPKRKAVSSPRQGTNDSVGSASTSSVSESAPEESETTTPRNSGDAPFGLKSAKRGMLQTIQVFVDDDILEYYSKSSESNGGVMS